jgi:hypothetical protein
LRFHIIYEIFFHLDKMASDGTPIDDIENGQVTNSADADRMREIMADIDSPAPNSAPVGSLPSLQQSPGPLRSQMSVMQPMYNPNIYTPVQESEEETDEKPRKSRKGNIWYSILSTLQDPLVVAILAFIMSTPALHVYLSKYIPKAYSIGGQLSWIGLIGFSLTAGLLFGFYQTVKQLVA